MPFKLNQDRRHHIPKQQHKVTNWREYDASLRQRGSLTVWFTDEAIAAWAAEPRTTPGGQRWYSTLAILTVLTLRATFRLALRQTEGLIGSVIQLLGLALVVPDHSTLCRRAEALKVSHSRPRNDGEPMHLLVDSTGLKLCGAGEWLVEKHGTKTRRFWRKLHIGMDAETSQIVAATLTTKDVDDTAEVSALLDQVTGSVASLTGDGAYDQKGVSSAVAEGHPSAAVIVPPRSTAVPSETAETVPTQRDHHLQFITKHGRAAWQKASGSTLRARAEAVIGRFKQVIGEDRHRLRLRPDLRRATERTSPSMLSTVCWNWDARSSSASPKPDRMDIALSSRLIDATRSLTVHVWTSGNRGREHRFSIMLRSGRSCPAVRTMGGGSMTRFVGLDVSQKLTAICVVDETGRRLWRGQCATDPGQIERMVRGHAGEDARIGVETGPMTSWLVHELRARGLDVICLDARHASAALKMQMNKTDQNDAEGLAQIMRTGWYRAVHVKSLDAHRARALLGARAQVVGITTRLWNHIRGVLKTFGLLPGAMRGLPFDRRVEALLANRADLASIVRPMLVAWRQLREQVATFDKAVRALAKADPTCRLLMSVPGIGVLSVLAYVSTVEDPARFARSRSVGAHLGLTPRQYQSGEVDRSGRISRCGDTLARTLLYEAAVVLLTRVKRASRLKEWAQAIAKRSGSGKARVALARKLSVILHSIWQSGEPFRWSEQEPAQAA